MSKPTPTPTKYKTTNWKAGNRALMARGSLTMWLDRPADAMAGAGLQHSQSPPAAPDGVDHGPARRSQGGLHLLVDSTLMRGGVVQQSHLDWVTILLHLNMTTKRVAFDIETDPFSLEFNSAKTPSARVKHAPKMRVACVFDESNKSYKFYTPEDAALLIEEIQSADELISFNGKGFDILVLRKHYGLKGKVPLKGRHIDIHSIMTDEAGFRVSLDKAVSLNFHERKHTSGREMNVLNLDDLKIACQSDVSQTYRLWLKAINGQLKIPQRRRNNSIKDIGPGHHMPKECPNCHDVGSLVFFEWDTSDMTDGQFSDYMAGAYGSAICETCGHEIDYGF
jgi:hypothetical protein